MAELPSAKNLRRSTPGSASGVVKYDAPTVPNTFASANIQAPDVRREAGAGMKNLASGLDVMNKALEERAERDRKLDEQNRVERDKQQLAQAQAYWTRSQIEIESSFVGDNDWGTYEQRYTEASSKALQDASNLIGSATVARAFLIDADIDIARGKLGMQKKAQAKSDELFLAGVNTELSELSRSLQKASTDAPLGPVLEGQSQPISQFDKIHKLGAELIKSTSSRGASATSVAKTLKGWEDTVAKTRYRRMDPLDAIDAIESENILDPDDQESMKNEIEDRILNKAAVAKEERLITTMQDNRDFVNDPNKTYNSVNEWERKQLSKTDDPVERQKYSELAEFYRDKLHATDADIMERDVQKGIQKSRTKQKLNARLKELGLPVPDGDNKASNTEKALMFMTFINKLEELGVTYDEDEKEISVDPSKANLEELAEIQRAIMMAGADTRNLLNESDVTKLLDRVLPAMEQQMREADGSKRYFAGGRSWWFDTKAQPYSTAFDSVLDHIKDKTTDTIENQAAIIQMVLDEMELRNVEGLEGAERQEAYSQSIQAAKMRFDKALYPSLDILNGVRPNAVLGKDGKFATTSPAGTVNPDITIPPGPLKDSYKLKAGGTITKETINQAAAQEGKSPEEVVRDFIAQGIIEP